MSMLSNDGRERSARLALAFCALAFCAPASRWGLAAEGLPLRPEGAGPRVVVGAAFDSAFMSSIAIAYPIGLGREGRTMELSASVAVPIFLLDGRHLRSDACARLELAGAGPLVIAGELAVAYQASSNLAYSLSGIGLDAAGLLAYRGEAWHAELEVSYRKNLANDVGFSDEYRSRVMASAKDGWYGSMGGTLAASVGGGVRFLSSFQAAAKAGVALTERLALPVPWLPLPPITLSLTLGYCIPAPGHPGRR